jgi:hypothetical protein
MKKTVTIIVPDNSLRQLYILHARPPVGLTSANRVTIISRLYAIIAVQ